MTIKNTVRLIQNSSLLLLLGLVVAVIGILTRAHAGSNVLALEFCIGGACIVLFFFRSLLVTRALKTSQHPGLLYALLEKTGLTQRLDLSLSDGMLDEIYKPTCSTEEFLLENHLTADIQERPPSVLDLWIPMIMGTAIIILLSSRLSSQQRILLFILGPIAIVAGIYLWKQSQNSYSPEPKLKFTDKGLWLATGETLSWKDIYDWHYEPGRKTTSEKMIINYYDQDRNIAESSILITELKADKLDILLLLTHYKGKYGQLPEPQ
jgi:hypothetical protein